MSILSSVAIRSLKKNKVRTAVTIIGIILSISMITSVTTLVSSFRSFFVRSVEARDGKWHLAIHDVNQDFYDDIKEDSRIKQIVKIENIGYAYVDGNTNEYKPYIFVAAFDSNAYETLPVYLISGRLPENENEIVIPEHMLSANEKEYKVGDVLKLDLGNRLFMGNRLRQSDPYSNFSAEGGEKESLVFFAYREYIITGIIERPYFEQFISPGYTAITFPGEKISDEFSLYVNMNNIKDTLEFIDEIPSSTFSMTNRDLLMYMGISDRRNFSAVLYSLSAILILLIGLGSISLIYNAFSISVNERLKQFGMLSSVGTTGRQIRKTVFVEAMAVGTTGIIGGVLAGIFGIGVTLHFIKDIIMSMTNLPGNIKLDLHVSVASVIAAVILGYITVFISAWIPSIRASRTTAIEAIRQNKEIKIKRSKKETPRIIGKIVGFEVILALKNFKRNKRKYTSTIISLFISIVLFVSANSFSEYLKESTQSVFDTSDYDISFRSRDLSKEKFLEIFEIFQNDELVTKSSYHSLYWASINLPKEALSKDFLEKSNPEGIEEYLKSGIPVSICVITDSFFADYASQIGIAHQEYLQFKNNSVVLIDKIRYFDQTSGRFVIANIIKSGFQNEIQLETGYTDGQGNFIAESTFVNIGKISQSAPMGARSFIGISPMIVMTETAFDKIFDSNFEGFKDFSHSTMRMVFNSTDVSATFDKMTSYLVENSISTGNLENIKLQQQQDRNVILIINVFLYGFIILISLISIANVFNTISTNINLRRRELAMLKSVGMTRGSFNKMMGFECIFYGVKALFFGLPVSAIVTYGIYRSVAQGVDIAFTLPWKSMAISTLMVFVVVSITMLYAISKLRKENIVEALRDENI